MLRGWILLIVLLSCASAPAAGPTLLSATLWGTAGDDDIQGVSGAADGTIVIAGNTAAAIGDVKGVKLAALGGEDVSEPKCGHGFVARLSADGKQILHYSQFPRGVVFLTSVAVVQDGVLVSGYASDGLEIILKDKPGLMREYPLRAEIELWQKETAAGKEDKIAGRPHLGRYGAPFVVKLSTDLSKVIAGTYLEGWQQVWDKKRVSKQGQQMLGGWVEYFWQPTHLAVLRSGEVVVGHDGGYFRMPRPDDLQRAGGDQAVAERMRFYDCCDYVSKLSADLSKREWKQALYTPPVDAEVARRVKAGWTLPHYSNPRTTRMRLDAQERVWLCGWSASATSQEPYWSPYLLALDQANGHVVKKLYEYDPMSGGGNRMGGQVADTAILTLAPEADGKMLVSLLADGGNTVIGWSPKADGTKFEGTIKGKSFGIKLVHWWGQVQRVDTASGTGLGGARIGPWGWVVDLAPLGDGGVMALGRCNWKFDTTEDAWAKESPAENPIAFVRTFSPEMDLQFSSLLPGVYPFELLRVGPNRYALTGRADAPGAVVKNALMEQPAGKSDGYLMILEAGK